MLSNTLTVLVPVLFVLLLGYFAGRAKAFSVDQVAGINELTLDYALPASLFVGIVGIARTQLAQDLTFVVIVLAGLVGVYVLAILAGILVFRLSASAAAIFALGAAFPSAPFFGPAILGPFFGPRSAIAIASVAIGANLLIVPVTVVMLETAQRAQRASAERVAVSIAAGAGSSTGELPQITSTQTEIGTVIRDGIIRALKQPYVWAPVIALVLLLFGIRVPALISAMLNLIGQTTSGVSLFVSGLLLAAYSLRLNGLVAR